MPIDVKVKSNKSGVRVTPNSNDNVFIRPEPGIENKRYDALIKEEKQERIAADDNLQAQIIEKENKIKYIEIFTEEGYFDENVLNSLKASKVNKIIYNKRIYSLGTRDEKDWTYVGSTNNPNLINTVIVDIETGEYEYVSINNRVLEEHIADNSRHITDAEREFWNNKVTADVTLENPAEQEYKLNLLKD